ncbi:MAG TPA: oligosaccharide flippase family protein [Solirubrobacteraceae bacterium]|nr:oligosaccharide flippase family protein [Solirubrobacteraceae bacterium]
MAVPPSPGLRRLAARGTLVNGAFDVALTSLGLIRGFVVAAFLSTTEYGVFGVLAAALGTVLWLKQVGIGDKYVQQRDEDQERAFQLAFTLELALSACFLLVVLALVPLMTLVYGEDELLAPGFAASLAIVGVALQTPIWPYYRSMDFFRQRMLQAVDPLLAFVVTIALAAAGAGYWALVIGMLAGSFGGAAAAVAASPFPLRLRWERGALREYASFSWPLLLASFAGVLIAQSATLVAELSVGLAGVGAVALASAIVAYTGRVDQIVTQTLYPAICRVVDRREALIEAFVKSNRLAVSFGLPFGVGLALFAEPLIDDVLGERWRPALGLVQAFALIAAVDQLGFNWTAFYRALGRTKPIAVANVAAAVVFGALAIPLLLAEGLDGLAIGMAATTAVALAIRAFYVRRLFPDARLARHALRATVPAALGAAAVLALGAPAVAELAAYLAIVAAATWALQGELLREAAGYLVRPRPA